MSGQLWVAGTESQLLRVIRNLLTNAAIHTRPEGGIRLRAGLAGDLVFIQVEDDGPGMTPEAAAHAFERFWRADESRVRATGGSGLGLSIVESMVTAHGGTIRLDSSVQAGTRVSITLPALQPALAAIAPGGGSGSDGTGL
jgi:two-component system OmpR family sensor kinase